MAQGVHKITEQFEKELCKYTGARYAVAVDNQSNALFLALSYEHVKGREISIPCHTYPSVPCEIIRAGAKVVFEKSPEYLTGAYPLKGTRTWDSALKFDHDMYIKGTFMCLSFTGPFKHLKLSKGGAILTDDKQAYEWFKRVRFSGRRATSYHNDDLDMLGHNYYMMPEIAARGLLLMSQFYDEKGAPKSTLPLSLKYPDLSKFKIYQNQMFPTIHDQSIAKSKKDALKYLDSAFGISEREAEVLFELGANWYRAKVLNNDIYLE